MKITKRQLKKIITEVLSEASSVSITTDFKAYLEKIVSQKEVPMKKGTKIKIKDMQQFLVDSGHELPKHGVDGKFGPETKKAVQDYQKSRNVKDDGVVDKETAKAMLDNVKIDDTKKISSDEKLPSEPLSSGEGFMKVSPGMLTSAVSGISNDLATYALSSFRKYYAAGEVKNLNKLMIVDYTIPGSKNRFWLLSTDGKTIQTDLFTKVAHGKNSGASGTGIPTSFSNKDGSKKSSVGALVTASTYQSSAGRPKSKKQKGIKATALKTKGLDSTNNADGPRSMILHGAHYVKSNSSSVGRSWGCLSVPDNLASSIISFLGTGTFGYKFGGSSSADKVDTSWITNKNA